MTVPVEIYTSRTCGYCHAAKELLRGKSIAYMEFDVTSDHALRSQMTARANGRTSVPQIFVGDVHVGGCDDLYALDSEGRLDNLLVTGTLG
jgi:glutaredoxin 3